MLKEQVKGFVILGYFDHLGVLNTENGQKNHLFILSFFLAGILSC